MSRETTEGWESPYRPPVEQRWVAGDGVFEGRTEPGRILVRSKWMYSPTDESADRTAKSKGTWAFSRGASVVSTDWPHWIEGHDTGVADNLHRAISSYGDDVDLVIEVRLARPEEASDGS